MRASRSVSPGYFFSRAETTVSCAPAVNCVNRPCKKNLATADGRQRALVSSGPCSQVLILDQHIAYANEEVALTMS
jgi:hypothetical protein